MNNQDTKAIGKWLADFSSAIQQRSAYAAFRGRLDRLRNIVKRALNFSRADIQVWIVPTFGDPPGERCKDSVDREKSSEKILCL